MRKIVLFAVIVGLVASSVAAQETYFGKNKVRYRDFEWSYIQTRHFDIHFYDNAYTVAKFAAESLESAYLEISDELNYNIQHRVPVFLYNSSNDMQQTNIIPSLLSEGIGGFTEPFKNRIAVPFTGAYEDFRHVLHHELTHAMTNNMLFGGNLASLLSRQRLFDLPHWFSEGFAEYSSRHGWDYNSDMFMRDATINNYLIPIMYLQYNYFAYRQGQAMVKYIVDKYGEDKLHKLMQKGKVLLTMNKSMKAVLGVDEEEFFKDFSKEMKRRYWPSIATLKEADEIGKQLTKAREDGSYFNEKPVYSPDGDKIAIFTDKSDYTEIVLISPYDGKHLRRLVKSQRSGDLESLHAYVSGMSFSPDGEKMVFVAKSKGKESLFFFDIDKGKVYLKKRMDYQAILNPDWSPDGTMIAFSALDGPKADLYVYMIDSDKVIQVTDDRYDDVEPSWLPNSSELMFASDHPHPQNPVLDASGHPYLIAEAAFMPGDFEYGTYNLFRVDLAKRRVRPVDVGPGHNRQPKISPDGDKVAFLSNRNGIDNIYVSTFGSDTNEYHAVTNIMTGVRHVSWAPSADRLVFSAYFQGAFDIFILEELVPQGEDGILAETNFVKGTYAIPTRPDPALLAETETDTTADNTGAKTEIVAPETGETIAASTEDTPLIAEAPEEMSGAEEPVAAETGGEATGEIAVGTEETDGDGGDEAEPVEPETTEITETGIYDDEFVYVGDPEDLALDSVLQEIQRPSDSGAVGFRREEPAAFDSIPQRLASGEYRINPYKAKLSTDYVGGGFSYDTFFGVRGQTVFAFSDHLGNHQVYLATDLVNSLDQSFIQAYYFNNKRRTSLGAGLFHTKNYYEDTDNFLFSDRFYGVQGFASRPFSTFSRVDFSLMQVFIDRKYYDRPWDDRENNSSEITSASASYVFDNVLWGYTGPINGRRFKLTFDGGTNLFDSKDISFTSVGADYRRYWHIDGSFSAAFRLSGGASFGGQPKRYFLGGTTNWIGTRTLQKEVYDVENLYFADVVTPLRGQDYYGISGDRYFLMNWEFRFPLVQYFVMKFPLPLVIANVQGATFLDMGAAWSGDNFKGGSSSGGDHLEDIKTGFGMGMRVNLFGFALLRYDLAWATDWREVSHKPTSYFSFGADF